MSRQKGKAGICQQISVAFWDMGQVGLRWLSGARTRSFKKSEMQDSPEDLELLGGLVPSS
jgi:hypothetical protein